ncbi:MAG: hypothetical protein MJ063_03200 [Lachnospiraceae bacterium]|nr:hypothetical protein [Lachnospiraceae bacterium]
MNVWDVILAAAVICAVVFAVSKAIKRRGRCAGCDGSCAGCRICEKEEKPAAKEEETK